MSVNGDGRIWIQGAGELASGVAFRLFRCGYEVVMAEIEKPRSVRRLVCFSEAVHAGSCVVEGVPGRLCTADELGFSASDVVVVVDPQAREMARLAPSAVIDARMTKREPAPLPRGNAILIGLGPGFRAGRDCEYVIETHRLARLGEVIRSGEAAADTGVPGPVGGHSGLRLLRAPVAGRLRPVKAIGDRVRVGDLIGDIDGHPLMSRLDGTLRGLIHPDVELSPGEKVGDVDPRGDAVDPGLVSDKALAVAGGVLAALIGSGVAPDVERNGR